MKNKSVYRSRIVFTVLGVLLFAALIFWLIAGLDNAQSASDEQRLQNLRQSVINGAVMCYSVEGFYPENISYLKEKYGLTYDEKRYEVKYNYVAVNRRPNVIVSEKDRFAEVVG